MLRMEKRSMLARMSNAGLNGLGAALCWSMKLPMSVLGFCAMAVITAGSGACRLSRHDPWTVRFGYQASRGRFVRSWHIASFHGDVEFGRYRDIADMAGRAADSTGSRLTHTGSRAF